MADKLNCITLARSLAAMALLCAAAAAPAQAPSDSDRCTSITGNPDLAIQYCTRAIESGKFSGGELAKLHYNRGIELSAKGMHDRAIVDHDTAIRLDPKFADAYYGRGNAWSGKGDSDRAIADFDIALGLNPKDKFTLGSRAFELTIKGDYARSIADHDAVLQLDAKSAISFNGRGRARLYTGDFPRAIADLQEAMKLEPSSYTALWLYLARKRAGIEGDELLEQGTADIRGGGWPWPVVVLFLGRTDVDSVMAAATDRNAARQREQRCEASFYVAQWYLLRNDRDRALPLLKEAQSDCPREFLEHEGAVAELRRLAANPK